MNMSEGVMHRLAIGGKTITPPAIVFILFLSAWQGACQLFHIPSYLLPTPLQVWQAGWVNRIQLFQAMGITFESALLGYLLSIAVGILAALIMSQSKLLERSLYPYAVLLQTIPIVAIAPLIVIWVGAGTKAIVFISFLIALFPILSNTNFGLVSTDHNLVDLMRLYHASRWTTAWKVRFPYALPNIIAGMKISSGLAVIGAIVGQFIAGIGGGKGGLGYVLISTAQQLQMSYLFAAALASCLLGVLAFILVSVFSGVVIGRWHESAQVHE